MTWRAKTSAILLSASLAALAATGSVRADDAAPTTAPASTASLDEQVAASATRQQALKSEVAQAADKLDGVIAEFEANGMGQGQDVKTLRAVRAALGKLSGKQMDQVIALLQQARAASDPGAVKSSVAQAYTAQQNILTQMRQIMITCQEQTDLIDLSVQFGQLADRQNKSLKDAKHFARQTGGNKANLNEGQVAQLQVQQADESALRDEVKARLDKLATLADQVDSATAAQLSKVMNAIPPANLLSSLEDACVGLRQMNVFQAAVAERKVRDQLREMARLVAPPRSPDQILSDSADAVKNQIDQQQQVVAAISRDRQLGWREDVREPLDDSQGDVVDAIDEVRKDIQPLATIPYNTLGAAQQQMQNGRTQILGGNINGAVAPATNALATLTQARQELLDALKQAREAEAAGQTKLQAAQSVQVGLKDLRHQEELAMAQAKAAKTPKLMKAAADKQLQVLTNGQAMEPDAADGPPDVSDALADALTHMDTAHDDLTKDGTPANALPEQQKAIDVLDVAQKKADDHVAQLQKEDEEAKKLKEASAAVGKLITRQEQVEISTAIVSARPAGAHADDPSATPLPSDNQLADKQGTLKDDTGQVATTLPGEASDAAGDLQGAQQSMGDAQSTLGKSDPAHASAPQQKAVTQLEAAKKAIDQALQQLAQDTGQPEDQQQENQQNSDQAQQKIEAAEQAIARAQQDLNQNKNDAAANEFQQADVLTSQAKNMDANLPPQAQQGLEKAQTDLKKGATDAAAQKTPDAKKDAAQALADLTQADQSMQLADADLAQQQDQNQQDQNSDNANQEPGNHPPKKPGNGDPRKQEKPMALNGNGPRGTVDGDSAFAGLPARDRQAITQSQAEKEPEEYGQMIQQYMQNLAEDNKK